MSRLANQAALGYVPLPNQAAEMIASYIQPADEIRVFDPCAGEGRAIGTIATILGVERARVYANELNDTRAKVCETHAGTVLACDTLKSLQATRNGFQLGYLNPPFDHDGKEEGGGRLEPKFFHRVVEDGHWVQPGGLVVIVTPQDVLARSDSAKHLARCYDDLRIYALPPEIRHYREAVVFGVVRDKWRTGVAQQKELARLQTLLLDTLPLLSYQAAPVYTLPAPLPVKKGVVWRDGSTASPAQAQQDVVATGGAWGSKQYHSQRAAMHRPRLRPLFPLHPAQAALRIANGEIDGREVELFGKVQLLKGSTREEEVTWEQKRETSSSTIEETHTIKRQVPQVVTVDNEGKLRLFLGDKGMAQLMNNERTADALLSAVEEASPPRYTLDMEPDVQAVLDSIIPASGRALPGYPPGLLAMQKHVVGAIHRAITTPDSSLDNTIPDAAILAAEMGTGKSAMGLAIAEVLSQLSDRPRKRRRR